MNINDTRATVVGIDPGESVGVVTLPYIRQDGVWQRKGLPLIFQCHHQTLPTLLEMLIDVFGDDPIIFSHERFVANLRAAKSKKASAGRITRDINGMLQALPGIYAVVEHTASQVKSWAITERLAAAGLLLTPKMCHAQDAGAQALFAATYDLGAPDPLSKHAKVTPDVTHHPDSVTINTPGLYQYGVRVTKINGVDTVDAGAPGTEATVTFDSSGGVHEVMRRVIDSQAADQARYIGLERHGNEQR